MNIFLALFQKDFLLYYKDISALLTTFLFSIVLLLLFNFALESGQTEKKEFLAVGIYWVVFFYQNNLLLQRSIVLDTQNIERVLASPVPRLVLMFSKLASNWVLCILLQLLLIPIFAVFFEIKFLTQLPFFLGILILSSLGFCALGTLISVLTIEVRSKEYPAIADFELTQSLRQASQKLQIPLHLGIGISSDTFWAGQERYDGYSGSVLRKFQGSLEEWQKLGLLNFEMEASALFTICSVFKLQAASICCVIAKRTKSEKVDKSKYQKGIERIMKIIQEAIKDLH